MSQPRKMWPRTTATISAGISSHAGITGGTGIQYHESCKNTKGSDAQGKTFTDYSTGSAYVSHCAIIMLFERFSSD